MKHTKKIVIGILVMLMSLTAILTLVACGGGNSSAVKKAFEDAGYSVTVDKEDGNTALVAMKGTEGAAEYQFITVAWCNKQTDADALKIIFDLSALGGMESGQDGKTVWYGTADAIAIFQGV